MNAENVTYIYDRKEWPHFTWDAKALAGRLGAVHALQGRLLGRMQSLGLALRAEAALQGLTEEVIKSSEIEGEILNKDQVRSSIARRLGMEIGGLKQADRHVDGVVAMMLDATQRYIEPLTKARLFSWHASLFPTGWSGMRQIAIGKWRDGESGPMQVVSGPLGREYVHYEAPGAAVLDAEMRRFLVWFNGYDGHDLLLRAGLAHFWFVTIHPFEDGNGRIARAIADMALARSEKIPQRFYSMSAQIREERDDYYACLEQAQKSGLDITFWLDWFLGCLGRALEKAEGVLENVFVKAEFWEAHRDTVFNERQRLVIDRLQTGFEGKLTSSKWAKLAHCSQDTASRDIDDLIEKGVLVKDAAGGRSTHYLLSAQ
jgi:Fic family protein